MFVAGPRPAASGCAGVSCSACRASCSAGQPCARVAGDAAAGDAASAAGCGRPRETMSKAIRLPGGSGAATSRVSVPTGVCSTGVLAWVFDSTTPCSGAVVPGAVGAGVLACGSRAESLPTAGMPTGAVAAPGGAPAGGCAAVGWLPVGWLPVGWLPVGWLPVGGAL